MAVPVPICIKKKFVNKQSFSILMWPYDYTTTTVLVFSNAKKPKYSAFYKIVRPGNSTPNYNLTLLHRIYIHH